MKGGGGVVLMVADGRQMEQSELVAAYAAGMVSMSLAREREVTKREERTLTYYV